MYGGIKKGAYLDHWLQHMPSYQYKSAGEKPLSISKLLKTLVSVRVLIFCNPYLLGIPMCYTEAKQMHKMLSFNSNSSVERFLQESLQYI